MAEEAKKRGNFATRVKDLGLEVKELRENVEVFEDVVNRQPEILTLLDHPFVRDFKYWETKIKRLEQMLEMVLRQQGTIEQQLRRAENLVTRAELSRTRGA